MFQLSWITYIGSTFWGRHDRVETVELDHLLAPDDVAIEIVHLASQGIERPNGAPLLIVACPLRHGRLQSPGGGDFRPALIAKLIQKQRDHCVRDAARRRADSGAAAAPCCDSRDQD